MAEATLQLVPQPQPAEHAGWSDDDTERFWDLLLDSVARDNIVPIIGQELLECEIDGQPVLLHRWLADQLRMYYGLNVEHWLPYTELNQAVSLVVQKKGLGELTNVYDRLWGWYANSGISPPKLLKQLAGIEPISLFIATTFDGLVADALDEVRLAANKSRCDRDSFSLSRATAHLALSGNQDITRPTSTWERRTQNTVVYNLFGTGSYDTEERYAIHDEDVLEYVHLFTSMEELLPEWLRGALRKKRVLMLGCHFSDWLTRFLVRRGTDKRLLDAAAGKCVIASHGATRNTDLVEFLDRFSRIQIYPGSATEFVTELVRRWNARPPARARAQQAEPASGRSVATAEVKDVSVFISYVREDRPAVDLIAEQLEQIGAKPWIDTKDIPVAGQWRPVFEQAIENKVDLFLAVISNETERQAIQGSEVYREWERACDRAKKFPPRRPFVFPIVVDEQPTEDFGRYINAVNAIGEKIQFGCAPQGRFDDKLKADMRSAIRFLRGGGQ